MDDFSPRTGCAEWPPSNHHRFGSSKRSGNSKPFSRELEDGTTSLEDALTRYERGVGLLRQCYAQLRDAEQRVKLLAGLTESGSADLRPFEHTAAIETAKASVRKGKAGQ